jgi:hypothetical protein
MLISESHGFLFVHVQKTAGTSVTQFLAPHALSPSAGRLNKIASDLGLVHDWRRNYFRIHAPLRRAERVLPPDVFASLFKFAFVRNPWDRLVSWYVYVLRDTGHRRHAQVRDSGSFAQFVQVELARPRRSQWWMLEQRSGDLGVDFVGRFERLEEDMAAICAHIGIPYQPLPRENVSKREPYQSYYTPELAELVRQRLAREIEAFGYAFD